MDSQSPHSPAGDPIHPQIVPERPTTLHVVLEEPRRGSRLGRRLLWAALAISLLANMSLYGAFQSYFQSDVDSVREKYHSLSREATDKVAIISLEGTIMGEDSFTKKQIERVAKDPHVKAVVLRVDSPGGTVTGSDFLYHHLKKMVAEKDIPLVVSMGSIAASGGYYVAMAAGPHEGTIYAEPSCWTGSIGVIIPHYDVSSLLAKWDIQDDSIASHPLKQMGSPTAKLPEKYREQERAILQELVDVTFKKFKSIVLESRPKLQADEEAQSVVFTGRIFTAGEAKQQGLVDELGFVEDAIGRAITLAGLKPDAVRVVKYQKPTNLMDQLLLGSQSRSHGFDLSALLDLTAPRAYYLCTWLPAVAHSQFESN